MYWNNLADKVLAGEDATREDAVAVMNAPENEILALLHAAFRIRERFWGRGVNIHILENAKSGLCKENCSFCSQATKSADCA